MYREISLRVVGFIISLILTLSAYYLILNPNFMGLTVQNVILIILTLALLQALVQLIFFIDVWHEKGSRWNLTIFISTVSIIFVVVFFSIWIMNHLNYNMHM